MDEMHWNWLVGRPATRNECLDTQVTRLSTGKRRLPRSIVDRRVAVQSRECTDTRFNAATSSPAAADSLRFSAAAPYTGCATICCTAQRPRCVCILCVCRGWRSHPLRRGRPPRPCGAGLSPLAAPRARRGHGRCRHAGLPATVAARGRTVRGQCTGVHSVPNTGCARPGARLTASFHNSLCILQFACTERVKQASQLQAGTCTKSSRKRFQYHGRPATLQNRWL